jgi:starch synthase (maltosyl-transferring)
VRLPLWRLGVGEGHPLVMQDLLTNREYTWTSEWNYVELNPQRKTAHLFRVIKT